MSTCAYYVNFSSYSGTEDHAKFDDFTDALEFYKCKTREPWVDYAALEACSGRKLCEFCAGDEDEGGPTEWADYAELHRLAE